jgi:hypothetical protein
MVSTTKMRGEGCLVPSFRAPPRSTILWQGLTFEVINLTLTGQNSKLFKKSSTSNTSVTRTGMTGASPSGGPSGTLAGIPHYGDEAEIENGECLKIFFDSAWSPPVKAYEKLEELGFTITASYYEPGCDFCGEWENGQDYEYCLKDAPAHLDRLYGISEMLEMIE